jgi:spore maturation protein SpmA
MEAQNQADSESPFYDRFRGRLIAYTDSIIRGLISFGIVSIGLYCILIAWLGMNKVFYLPIVFIVAILSSPLFSRIKFGELIWGSYERWLRKTFR